MLALLKLNLLRAPFESILGTTLDIQGRQEVVQPMSLINLMTTLVVNKENNIDIWKKVMHCFRITYTQCQQVKQNEDEKNVLEKNDIIVAASILAEIGSSDAGVWDCLQNDISHVLYLEKERFTKV